MIIEYDLYHNPNVFELLPSICISRVKGQNQTCWTIMIGFCTIYFDVNIEYNN